MDSLGEAFFSAFGAVMFCLALTIMLGGAALAYGLGGEYARPPSIACESDIDIDIQDNLTYGELIAVLMADGLDCDLEIGGRLIDKADYTPMDIEMLGIVRADSYRRSYVYDSDGRVVRVKYDIV